MIRVGPSTRDNPTCRGAVRVPARLPARPDPTGQLGPPRLMPRYMADCQPEPPALRAPGRVHATDIGGRFWKPRCAGLTDWRICCLARGSRSGKLAGLH
jgi:hypothetical protein